jgi:stearoyl-CoA desaturase (delta-9 desaturase)
MQFGLIDLPWWGAVLVALGMTHVTIISVTIFLHRYQTHRALTLHPVASHFFRFWLWLTTGMVTGEWVAIHRKHHATTDTAEDPHSPQVHGIRKVLFEGVELYRRESKNAVTLEKYARGTPNDWIERNLYTKYTRLGIGLMLGINIALFGPIGLTIWATQMLWVPLFAAGVINGLGHYWGYRNFAPPDASKNIVPWGILIGGEELHNNHHAYVTSARFSFRWWECDIGWIYVRILQELRLAKVNRVAPRIRYNAAKVRCDANTLQAVMMHRYHVLATFARFLHLTTVEEMRKLRTSPQSKSEEFAAFDEMKRLLQRDMQELLEHERVVLVQALKSSKVLETIYSMRQDLIALWNGSTGSKEQLVKQLEDWCRRAEETRIGALRKFSRMLRCYELSSGDMK